ncbi:MAG: hypothetical protein GVY13_03100 [Alphaproteobacteria bacterium]|jgi:uncharacterized membrane protein|nr:hypothetical protein [Alphaproteobacteria bacterium]
MSERYKKEQVCSASHSFVRIKHLLKKLSNDDLIHVMAIVLILAIFTPFCLVLLRMILSLFFSSANLGAFGDFIGGIVNPIFGFLSLIAILVTLILQNQELQATRKEITASARAQKEQVESWKKQLEMATNKEKRDTTFQVLQRWTSPHMRECRTNAWDHLHSNVKDFRIGKGKKIYLSYYSDEGATFSTRQENKIADGFLEVCQFISDLHKMTKSDVLDDKLMFVLFYNSLYPWFQITNKRRFEQGIRSDYDNNVEEWYRIWVMGFKSWWDENYDRLKVKVGDDAHDLPNS